MANNLFDYEGQVQNVTKVATYGANGFKKCELVCFANKSWDGRSWTEYAHFEVKKDLADEVQRLKMNDHVKVTFKLNARSWQKESGAPVKWFDGVEAIRVVAAGETASVQQQEGTASVQQQEGTASVQQQGGTASGQQQADNSKGEQQGAVETVNYDEVAEDMPF